MPKGDGTGPMARGVTNGRGLGICNRANAVRAGTGLGLGNRRGCGNSVADPTGSKTPKELLQKQKELLENKLDSISKQLESL
ncbi:conserved hypothetical protein [Candidatus Desulfosporosinus infrequens]|uniref:DUF5320 domain-containing protein n=1 Tax=Candidatus Desulfosporosinus infrequens TaxID=2043169 RepID=A0A2U3K1E9_9FIRM|nr:conserved hypothetical protein [Candidatus Desulfosporosinus infrequens]